MCKNEKMQLLLSGHLDGCNTPDEEQALREHLAQCPDCRQALEEYENIERLLRESRQEVPAGFAANVMRAVEAEPRKAASKTRRWPFGFATAAAAVAAVLLLAVNAGWLPSLSMGSAKLADSATPAAAEPATAEEPAAPAEALLPEPEAAPVMEESSFSAAKKSADLPANVDARALAEAEHCPVGVLYADPAEIPELAGRDCLPLSGGAQYRLSQNELNVIGERFPDLEIFSPENHTPDDEAPALLIVVTP